MPETEPVVLVAPDYDEHVAVVTINRAKKKGALSEEVVLLLTAAFLELGDDKRISAVVLRSSHALLVSPKTRICPRWRPQPAE